jgi:quercetin dioxygenase-like cupin family protein
MTTLVTEPVVTAAGESRIIPILLMGQELLLKIGSQDTSGVFSVFELKAPPMSGPPLHVHTREDEWFYILSGELTFQLDGQRIVAGPGASVLAPRNVPHTFQNFGDATVEALLMMTPGPLENFFVQSATTPPDQFEALMNSYGMQILGPPLAR